MWNKLRGCLVALTLGLFATTASSAVSYLSDITATEKIAWNKACTYKAVDCTNIPAPAVWYMPLGNDYGRYYHGMSGVMVNMKLAGQTFSGLIMVHEMVHYIQQFQLLDNPMYRNSCARESEAFNITVAVAYEMGYTDGRLWPWGPMAGQYGCLSGQHKGLK